jgi:hypothetical protein
MEVQIGKFFGKVVDGPPMTMLPGDGGEMSVGSFSHADLRKTMANQDLPVVAFLGEFPMTEQTEAAGSAALLYGVFTNYLSPGARNLLGGGLGLIALAALYGWWYADQELIEIHVDKWQQLQQDVWREFEGTYGITRWDLFHYAIIEYELQQLTEFGEYSLADNRYRNPDAKNMGELMIEQAKYREMFDSAPTPPPYIDLNILHMMKRDTRNNKRLQTIAFLIFFFVIRKRKKKKRSGWFSPKSQ